MHLSLPLRAFLSRRSGGKDSGRLSPQMSIIWLTMSRHTLHGLGWRVEKEGENREQAVAFTGWEVKSHVAWAETPNSQGFEKV